MATTAAVIQEDSCGEPPADGDSMQIGIPTSVQQAAALGVPRLKLPVTEEQ